MTRRTKESKTAGEKVLAVASDLFYNKGIHEVGVEEVVATAGVAKISLYRSFSSKDDLIVAYLESNNEAFWKEIDAVCSPHEGDPHAELHALMSYVAQRTTKVGYRGCPYISYCGEFPDHSHPGHRIAEANKREWRSRLLRIARALGAHEPKRLADGLMLLVEGAYALSQTLSGTGGPGKEIVWAAETLVDSQTPGRNRR
jgi:AcrR family transcriptional regulator